MVWRETGLVGSGFKCRNRSLYTDDRSNNNYVAIASFLNNDGKYSNATSGEFTSEENLDEETAPAIKDCIQIIEFRQEDVAISADGLDSTLEVGETGQAILKLSYDSCELQGQCTGEVF